MDAAQTSPPGLVFSIVVPTHRRPAQIKRCLRALADLEYPPSAYEIIVVDDGGDLQTERIAEAVGHRHHLSVRVVAQPRGGPATARNTGAAAARGRYLAFTDDDCVPARDWLSKLERRLTADSAALVGGLTANALPSRQFSTASQMLIDYLYDYYHVEQTGARFFTTNNMAVATDTFRVLGGFDESFPLAAGEDREFCERWQHSGRHLVYADEALVYHAHRLDLRGFVRQHFNYGRGADFLHRSRAKHDTAARRPKLEPLKFYFNLVRFPFTQAIGWRAIPLATLMFVSQAVYGTGYFLQRLHRAWKPAPAADATEATPATLPDGRTKKINSWIL